MPIQAFPPRPALSSAAREAGSMTAADHRPITLRNALASREPSIHALRSAQRDRRENLAVNALVS